MSRQGVYEVRLPREASTHRRVPVHSDLPVTSGPHFPGDQHPSRAAHLTIPSQAKGGCIEIKNKLSQAEHVPP